MVAPVLNERGITVSVLQRVDVSAGSYPRGLDVEGTTAAWADSGAGDRFSSDEVVVADLARGEGHVLARAAPGMVVGSVAVSGGQVAWVEQTDRPAQDATHQWRVLTAPATGGPPRELGRGTSSVPFAGAGGLSGRGGTILWQVSPGLSAPYEPDETFVAHTLSGQARDLGQPPIRRPLAVDASTYVGYDGRDVVVLDATTGEVAVLGSADANLTGLDLSGRTVRITDLHLSDCTELGACYTNQVVHDLLDLDGGPEIRIAGPARTRGDAEVDPALGFDVLGHGWTAQLDLTHRLRVGRLGTPDRAVSGQPVSDLEELVPDEDRLLLFGPSTVPGVTRLVVLGVQV